MATIRSTPIEAQFFIQTDPYRWDVDNRPLTHLLNNDVAINEELERVRDEVVQARTALQNVTYNTLDERLDAMEASIGASVSITDVEDIQGHQYGDFIANSEAIRRATPSGFLDHNGIADLGLGDSYDDFGGIRTTSSLGAGYENSIVLWTGWGATNRPIRAVVNGWIVRLYNEITGTPGTITQPQVTIDLGSAAITGKWTNFVFLEVWLEKIDKANPEFYKYGAVNTNSNPATVNDHLHPEVIHTVRGMAGPPDAGDWLQLRHRIRVVQDVNPATYPYGYNSLVTPQGPKVAGVDGYEYVNMFSELDDAGLWRAGNGDAQSISDLGSFDGYIYSIPISMVHRRNSGNYTLTNQNGSKLDGFVGDSGFFASALSGRPDDLYYDAIDQRDILDLRHKVSLSGIDVATVFNQSWQLLIRGELRTNWKQLRYDYNNDGIFVGEDVWGHTLTMVDEINSSNSQHTNPVRDRSVTNPMHPLSQPDGMRVYWSKTPTVQPVKFTFTAGSPGATPANLVTYNAGNGTLTFNANALPAAGVGGVKVASTAPIIMKKDNLSSQPVFRVSGLGTDTATITMTSGLVGSAPYVGLIYLIYPGGSGLEYPYKRILSHEVVDGSTSDTHKSQQYGTTGVPGSATGYLRNPLAVSKMSDGTLVVVDSGNHRVVTMDPDTLDIIDQFGVTGVSGTTDDKLNFPVGVVVGPGDAVFISDTHNHRVVKLDSTLGFQGDFGDSGIPGADNGHLRFPWHIASGTNLYVCDRDNHRLVELTHNLTYVGQFGSTGIPSSTTAGLNLPLGVAVVKSGWATGVGADAAIWVSDGGNRRVMVLNTSLQFQYQIRAEGGGRTLYQEGPTDVTLDANGNIYISLGDFHVVQKYSPDYILLKQYGTYGQVGPTYSNGTLVHGLNRPAGLAVDDTRGWLYVADGGNHRVLRLTLVDLEYVAQFGKTGISIESSVNPPNTLCVAPSDVAVSDDGNLYITQTQAHCVTKVLRTDLTQSADSFGTWKQYGGYSSTTQLNLPVGIAVKKSDASVIAVTDFGNNRVVILDGSLNYVRHFKPRYTPGILDRVPELIWDIEYSSESGTDWWYVTGYEKPPSVPAGAFNLMTPIIWRFPTVTADTPATKNYNARIEVEYGPSGMHVTATSFWIVSRWRGLGIFSLSDYNNYVWTADRTTTIIFPFTRPTGVFGSTASNYVFIAEPDVHCAYVFDSSSGIFLSSVGTPYEAGDDDCALQGPQFVHLDGDNMVVCDAKNHRILRRHVSSPWVSTNGTITAGVAPASSPSADVLRVFYETEAYQGMLNALGGGESIWKSQVRYESPSILATTLGLGNAMTSVSAEYKPLRGLTVRLPISDPGWDYWISPVGLKVGTADAEDDGPYLSLPVTISEGFRGGQTSISQEAVTPLKNKTQTQQICKTIAGTDTPRSRGLRSVLARNLSTSTSNTLKQFEGSQGTSTFVPEGSRAILDPVTYEAKNLVSTALRGTDDRVTVLRYGVPPVKSYNLMEAIPHLNYYPFMYQRSGVLVMAVISEISRGKAVGIGSYELNSVDGFYPQGRVLIR